MSHTCLLLLFSFYRSCFMLKLYFLRDDRSMCLTHRIKICIQYTQKTHKVIKRHRKMRLNTLHTWSLSVHVCVCVVYVLHKSRVNKNFCLRVTLNTHTTNARGPSQSISLIVCTQFRARLCSVNTLTFFHLVIRLFLLINEKTLNLIQPIFQNVNPKFFRIVLHQMRRLAN